MSDKTLVVTFDGLDKDLIDDFNLDLTELEEFGTLNNSEKVTTVITNELWACFITGKTWKEHGIISKNRPQSDLLFQVEKLNRFKYWRKFQGIRNKIYEIIPIVNSEKRKYDKRDLKSPTFFDKISDSKAIDVRSYNIGYNYDVIKGMSYRLSLGVKEVERFTKMKEKEVFDSMEKDYDLIMVHFHKPDHIQHWFWEVGKMEKVEETYNEMDELAAKIRQKAENEGFDTVLFISDHGLPDVENGGHNENAFYSCNRELFGDKTPHITDFHDKILELTGSDTVGIDV